MTKKAALTYRQIEKTARAIRTELARVMRRYKASPATQKRLEDLDAALDQLVHEAAREEEAAKKSAARAKATATRAEPSLNERIALAATVLRPNTTEWDPVTNKQVPRRRSP